VVAGPPEESPVQLTTHVGHHSPGGKRKADTGVSNDAGAQGRPGACVTAEDGLDIGRSFLVTDPLEGVGSKQTSVAGSEERKPELEAPASLLASAQVA